MPNKKKKKMWKKHKKVINQKLALCQNSNDKFLICWFLYMNKTEEFDHVDGVIALGENYRLEKIYPAADFIISSSAFGEGFSNSIAEGMSAGLIPIATKVGDAENIINGHGFLVSCRNVKALSEAIKKVLEIDENIHERKGTEIKNCIQYGN